MASTRKTWVSILIAVVIIAVIVCVAAIGGMALFVRSHVNTRVVPPATALEEFRQTRARFAGESPLIEIDADAVVNADDWRHASGRVNRAAGVHAGPVESVHVLAYDDDNEKLVHVRIPRWALQLASGHGRIRIANLDLGEPAERVTLEDLDRHGPGLILDTGRIHRGRAVAREGEVLIWAE